MVRYSKLIIKDIPLGGIFLEGCNNLGGRWFVYRVVIGLRAHVCHGDRAGKGATRGVWWTDRKGTVGQPWFFAGLMGNVTSFMAFVGKRSFSPIKNGGFPVSFALFTQKKPSFLKSIAPFLESITLFLKSIFTFLESIIAFFKSNTLFLESIVSFL